MLSANPFVIPCFVAISGALQVSLSVFVSEALRASLSLFLPLSLFCLRLEASSAVRCGIVATFSRCPNLRANSLRDLTLTGQQIGYNRDLSIGKTEGPKMQLVKGPKGGFEGL